MMTASIERPQTHITVSLSPPWTAEQAGMVAKLSGAMMAWVINNGADCPSGWRPTPQPPKPPPAGRLSEGWTHREREIDPRKWRKWRRFWALKARPLRWYQVHWNTNQPEGFTATTKRKNLAKGTLILTPPVGFKPGTWWHNLSFAELRIHRRWGKARLRRDQVITSPPAVTHAFEGGTTRAARAGRLTARMGTAEAKVAMGAASTATTVPEPPRTPEACTEFCSCCGATNVGSAYYCNHCDADLVNFDGDPAAETGAPDHPGPGRW